MLKLECGQTVKEKMFFKTFPKLKKCPIPPFPLKLYIQDIFKE